MNKHVIVGGGGHAKVVISILKKLNDYEIAGYVDPVDRGSILGARHLGGDDVLPRLFGAHRVTNAVLGIGQLETATLRRALNLTVSSMGFAFPAVISPCAVVNAGVCLGEGTVVMDGAVVNVGTRIGAQCILNTRSSVDHDCEIGEFVHICPGATLSGGVRVGSGSLIGAGATVIQRTTIGDACLIGAGAVVVTDCPGNGRYVGVPARPAR